MDTNVSGKDVESLEYHMAQACKAGKDKEAREKEIDDMDDAYRLTKILDMDGRNQQMELLRQAHVSERDHQIAAMMIISGDARAKMQANLDVLLEKQSRGEDVDGTLQHKITFQREWILRVSTIHDLEKIRW